MPTSKDVSRTDISELRDYWFKTRHLEKETIAQILDLAKEMKDHNKAIDLEPRPDPMPHRIGFKQPL